MDKKIEELQQLASSIKNDKEFFAKLQNEVIMRDYDCTYGGFFSIIPQSYVEFFQNKIGEITTALRAINDKFQTIQNNIDNEILDIQDNCEHDFVYEKEDGNDTVYVCTKCGERIRKNPVDKAREILEQDDEQVVLYCKSEKGPSDWYGDFSYMDNPLEHYQKSKMCEVEYDEASGHGWGIAGITVRTTMSFIKMMGWEKDLKYRVK